MTTNRIGQVAYEGKVVLNVCKIFKYTKVDFKALGMSDNIEHIIYVLYIVHVDHLQNQHNRINLFCGHYFNIIIKPASSYNYCNFERAHSTWMQQWGFLIFYSMAFKCVIRG